MGYVFKTIDADVFARSFKEPPQPAFADLQQRLMLDMMQPMRGKTILDIGCGDGTGLAALMDMGLQVTGLEPSAELLEMARRKHGQRVALQQGVAEDLPFDDNSFHYVSLVTTLEFADDVSGALEEACRVAKNRIFVGFINRYSFKATVLRAKGLLRHPLFRHASFLSIWELQYRIRSIAGDVPVNWGSACPLARYVWSQFPLNPKAAWPYKWPFGLYAGVVATLTPRFRTTPLPLTYRNGAKQATGAFSGSCISRDV